jgi:hypothetical protein
MGTLTNGLINNIAGVQLKSLAGILPNDGIFLEEAGPDKPHQWISDDSSIDLAEPRLVRFRTVRMCLGFIARKT